MQDPYVLTGSALDKFEDAFDLIEILLDDNDDDDTLVFDLAWLPDHEHRQLFKDLAEGRQIGKMRSGKLVLSKPYTATIIERFITFMGYGRPGMGTVYTTRERATPAQAAASYAKARAAMFENFKKNFAFNIPREALGHGKGKPRARTMRAAPLLYNYFSNNNNNNNNNNNEKEDTRMKIRINNGPNYGKMAGKKSSKQIRKGLPKSNRSRKLKSWTRNNNNNE
jgi:hypothetical protein